MTVRSSDVRRVLLVVHGGRPDAVTLAREVAQELCDAGIEVRAESEEAVRLVACGVVAVDARARGRGLRARRRARR